MTDHRTREGLPYRRIPRFLAYTSLEPSPRPQTKSGPDYSRFYPREQIGRLLPFELHKRLLAPTLSIVNRPIQRAVASII